MVPVNSFFIESRFVLLDLSHTLNQMVFINGNIIFLPFPNRNKLKYFSKGFLMAYLKYFFLKNKKALR